MTLELYTHHATFNSAQAEFFQVGGKEKDVLLLLYYLSSENTSRFKKI